MNTIWRWLRYYGFTYDVNKRSYYTDGHERDDVVKDRDKIFLGEYFGYELRAHCWVQISESTAIALEKEHKNFPRNVSYKYLVEGRHYREYHIDSHKSLDEYVTDQSKYTGKT